MHITTALQTVSHSRGFLFDPSVLDGIPQREPLETEYAYQARILSGFSSEIKHDTLALIRETTPVCDFLAKGRHAYLNRFSLPSPPDSTFLTYRASLLKGARVQQAVEGPTPPQEGARQAYAHFRAQNASMFQFLTQELGVNVQTCPDTDPYQSASEQLQDLQSRHLLTNRGEFFIQADSNSPTGTKHPYLTAEDYFQFRAVHDAFGHASIGSGFDRHGEYEAYVCHWSMYTGPGRKAMSSEYHILNTYLWYTGTQLPPEKYGIIYPDNLIGA